MIRLHLVVEGQTEELFVAELLGPDLIPRQIYPAARCVQTSASGSHPGKGGGRHYQHWKDDIERTLRSDRGREVYVTTMVDFFRLPKRFPGRDDDEYRQCVTPVTKVQYLERRLREDINDPRFIPYIQLHEFEALLFADPEQFCAAFPEGTEEQFAILAEVRRRFPTVDDINDGPATATAKRIISVFPEYDDDKATLGPLVAIGVGLPNMLDASPHFRQWLEVLRNLRPLGEAASSDAST